MINNKKSKILIGCLALLLVMAVGYALFSETITINGTATAKGDFDISFSCELLTDTFGSINGTHGGTGSCSVEGQTITTTSTLTKPTENVTYKVTLTNTGSIPAVLKTVDSSNNVSDDLNNVGDQAYFDRTSYLFGMYIFYNVKEFSNGNIYIMGDSTVENEKITLQPGETILLFIGHGWEDNSNSELDEKQPELPETGATMNYNVTLGFEQVQAN